MVIMDVNVRFWLSVVIKGVNICILCKWLEEGEKAGGERNSGKYGLKVLGGVSFKAADFR